jgi:hypothetical protein
MEVNYNEGWNVYNTETLVNHHLLYPVRYGWTTINYPMLSFYLLAQLHRFTHDYLFTARAVCLLSLLGCSLFIGLIVWRTTASRPASILAGFYCLALFCTNADTYVGADDPQMLSLLFFLAGLALYIFRRESLLAIAGVAGIFVIAGCIKHNPIEFPLAVLVDLILISRRRALWFSAWGLCFAGIAVALNIHYGGPYFLAQLMAPRGYSFGKGLIQSFDLLGPLLIPFCVALYMSVSVLRDVKQRFAAILLFIGVAIGVYFGGGQGVNVNSLFGALLAMCILIGMFFKDIETGARLWRYMPANAYMPLLLFGWLLIPMGVYGLWNPMQNLRDTIAAQKLFDDNVSFIRRQDGPALCESMLHCYFAGKPYLYDPFNATRLIQTGKLDVNEIVQAIHLQQYKAIQFDEPIRDAYGAEHFDTRILDAIQESYMPAVEHEDIVIYVPRPKTETSAPHPSHTGAGS